jgi:hypothetical protein
MAQNILSPVRVATNENISLSPVVGRTIDTILLVQGNRVLVKAQSNPIENGIYVVQSDGSLSRATDFAVNATQLTLSSAIIFVESGAIFAETGWILEPDTFTVGTSAITFKRFTINENLQSLVDDVLSYIVLRREKGSPLTNDELDNNFLYLSNSIEDRVRKVDYTSDVIIAKIKETATNAALLDVYSVRGKTIDDTGGVSLVTKDTDGKVTAVSFSGNLIGNANTATSASTADLAGNVTGVIAIENGGTGRTSASEARTALQVVHNKGDTITGKLVLAKPSGDDIALLNVGSTEPLNSVSGDVWLNESGQMRYNRSGIIYTLATLSSPSFTGTPSAPTPASNSNDDRIATTAFVQALKGGLELEIALKADAATSYTKIETDGLLALKADAEDFYTKTASNERYALAIDVYTKNEVYTKDTIDSSLNLKANLSDVYTQSDTNDKLALKADANDVYTIPQSDAKFATITYVDGLQDKWGTSKKFVQTAEPTGAANGDFWFKI